MEWMAHLKPFSDENINMDEYGKTGGGALANSSSSSSVKTLAAAAAASASSWALLRSASLEKYAQSLLLNAEKATKCQNNMPKHIFCEDFWRMSHAVDSFSVTFVIYIYPFFEIFIMKKISGGLI